MTPIQYNLHFSEKALGIPPNKKLTVILGLIYRTLNSIGVLHPFALSYALEFGNTNAANITQLFAWVETPIFYKYWRYLHNISDIIRLHCEKKLAIELSSFSKLFPWEIHLNYFDNYETQLNEIAEKTKDSFQISEEYLEIVPWNFIEANQQWRDDKPFLYALQNYQEKFYRGETSLTVEEYMSYHANYHSTSEEVET